MTKITYNGKTTELADGYIATLPCKDFKMETDVVVEAPEGSGANVELQEKSVTITENTTTEVTADEGKALSKVTIITEVASSGGEQPQLFTPTISILGDTLTITDNANGSFASGYNIYIGNTLSATVNTKTVTLTDYAEHTETVSVNVTAIGQSLTESAHSNTVTWKYTPPNAGTEGLTYTRGYNAYLCSGYGTATATEIVIADEIDGLPVVNIMPDAFANKYQITAVTLPNRLTVISQNAFKYTSITSIVFPETLIEIETKAFGNCDELVSATFQGTPSSIASDVFHNCYMLRDIYVPWAEGAVSGAPWGASNATIHYNSEV